MEAEERGKIRKRRKKKGIRKKRKRGISMLIERNEKKKRDCEKKYN